MNEFLKKRIERKLASLPEERVYQVLDYIEFLGSRYAEKAPPEPSALQKLAETVEDTLRAGRVSTSAIKGTMDVIAAAGRVMDGIAAAGKAVVDQVSGAGGAEAEKPEPPAGPAPAEAAPPREDTA